jgi:hypothetical protein
MAASKSKKKPTKASTPKTQVSKLRVKARLQHVGQRIKARQKDFLSRRPHRSFRRTRRRDMARSLELPGYWSFTYEVWKMLWGHRRLFGSFLVAYSILFLLSVGLMSQDSYTQLSDVFFGRDEVVGILDDVGAITSALALFATTVASSLTQQVGEAQQVVGAMLVVMGWLVVVWLLRQVMAGYKVRLRDGIYTAGAPLAAMIVLVIVAMVQLIPFALGLMGYNVAAENGMFLDGVEAMAIWAALLLLGLLSLYWMVGTFIAMIIVTLPGMYPFTALKSAGDLVVGRRLRIMLRLAWLFAGILPLWAFIIIPLIFLQGTIKITWLPLVPVAALLLGSFTLLWTSAYIYLLYRKLIDDEAPPA